MRSRITAIIAETRDLTGDLGISPGDLQTDDGIESATTSVHHALWAVVQRAEADAAGSRAVMKHNAASFSDLEHSAAQADRIPQSVFEARDKAKRDFDAIESRYSAIKKEEARRTLVGVFAAAMWKQSRSDALAQIRRHAPPGLDLPRVTNGDMTIPDGPFKPMIHLPPEPMQAPPVAAAYMPEWNDNNGQVAAAVAAEPAQPVDLNARVADLESFAARARAAQSDAADAATRLQEMKSQFVRDQQTIQGGDTKQGEIISQTGLYIAKSRWYEMALIKADTELRNEAWQEVYATSKALVWGVVEAKLVPHALSDIAKAPPVERAKKYAALAAQVRGLESDFEIWSSKAANVLALGSSAETEAVFDEVWNVHQAQGRETMDKALDAADAPPTLKKAWAKLLGAR